MGEYAKINGEEIKIGTLEDMYYLRFTQRDLVTAIPHNVDPVKECASIRFRFPFPDEDHIPPGEFPDFDRAELVPGYSVPEGVNHSKTQFTSPGYHVCLPCPESPEGRAFASVHKIHRNRTAGGVSIVQHRFFNGELFTVCRCNGCGAKFRLDRNEAEKVIVNLRSAADEHMLRGNGKTALNLNTIASRVAVGYKWENQTA